MIVPKITLPSQPTFTYEPPGFPGKSFIRFLFRTSTVQRCSLWWRQYSVSALGTVVTTSHVWLLSIWNVAGKASFWGLLGAAVNAKLPRKVVKNVLCGNWLLSVTLIFCSWLVWVVLRVFRNRHLWSEEKVLAVVTHTVLFWNRHVTQISFRVGKHFLPLNSTYFNIMFLCSQS